MELDSDGILDSNTTVLCIVYAESCDGNDGGVQRQNTGTLFLLHALTSLWGGGSE